MCGISGSWPRPFAVGVLALAGRDGVGYLAAERLAVHADADALVVRGPVDRARLAEVADRHRLTVRSSVSLPP